MHPQLGRKKENYIANLKTDIEQQSERIIVSCTSVKLIRSSVSIQPGAAES